MESVEQPTPPPPPVSGGSRTPAPQAPLPAPPQREVVTTISDLVHLESLAEIEVTYRRQDDLGLWLPWKMSELYEGPLRGAIGRAETTATYGETSWDRDEWDVALTGRAIDRVHRDRATGQWFMEGVWD